MEFEPMLTPREKSPLPENVPRGGSNPRHCGSKPKHYQLSYCGPLSVACQLGISLVLMGMGNIQMSWFSLVSSSSSSSSSFLATSLGFTNFDEIFACVTVFSPTIEGVTFRLSGCLICLALLYTQAFHPDSFLTAMFVGIMSCYHFMPLLVALTLAEDGKVCKKLKTKGTIWYVVEIFGCVQIHKLWSLTKLLLNEGELKSVILCWKRTLSVDLCLDVRDLISFKLGMTVVVV